MNREKHNELWPYGLLAAFLLLPLIWMVLATVLSLAEKTLGWPDSGSRNSVNLVVLASGFVPVILVLLDFLSSRGAVFSYKDWKIDFSHVDLSRPDLKRESFGLPANIGVAGPIVSDTAPMDIIETLRQASQHEIVVIDLQDGDAWWVTRLLALSAGAVRAGSPKALVLVGKQENQDLRFIGWSWPRDILGAILKAKPEYERRYRLALRIALQVEMYGPNQFLPLLLNQQVPPPQSPLPLLSLHPEVRRYTDIEAYTQLGPAVSEQILMDQLARYEVDGGYLENPPDRLTVARLNELFGHCLYRGQIDLEWPHDKQISTLLESATQYVALVRANRFESMLKREDGTNLIIRELYTQLQRAAAKQ